MRPIDWIGAGIFLAFMIAVAALEQLPTADTMGENWPPQSSKDQVGGW